MAENDPLDQLRQATAKLRGGSQSGTAVAEPEEEEATSDENSPLQRLRAATASLKASAAEDNHVPGSENVAPFSAAIPRTAPSVAAAKVGRPMIQLQPPTADITQIPRNVFTGGAQGPGMLTEEEIAKSGTIGPQPDVTLPGPHGTSIKLKHGDIEAAGKVFLPGLNRDATLQGNEPIINPERGLVAPQNLMTEGEQRQHPILTGLGQLGEGLTTSENLAILAGTTGFSELPAAARSALSAYFAAQMAKGATDYGVRGWKAYKRGDNDEAQRLWTLAAGSTVLGAGAGAHAIRESPFAPNVGPEPVVPKGTISEPLAMDERATPEGTIGPKQEPLAPESPKAINAQVDALKKGTNKVVYIPKGTESIPAPPENAKVTVVPGEQAGAGTWYHTDDVQPILILKKVKDGTFGELLGNHQGKNEVLASAAPVAVVARDADGNEVKASLVDSAKPEIVNAQAATLQRQFPDAKITIEKPEDVIHERLGTKPQEEEKSAATASTAPADLQPIIDQHAPDLIALSQDVRRLDPGLADGLSDIADGKLHRSADLQAFIDENIPEPKAKAELTKLVADYAAESADEEAQASSKDSLDKLRAATASLRASSAEKNRVPAAPEIGDQVQVTAGKLKGKTAEVTRATDEGGVYVRTDENSRIQYVKAGDFEGQTKPSFKTKALDKLVDRNDEEFTATRYSGLSPAAFKKLLPESAREKLDTEVEANQRARGLQGQLYELESKNAADLVRARNVLKEAPGTPGDMEAIYHHLEDSTVKLTSGQQKILDGYLCPLLDKSEQINEKLEGAQVENYVHRIPVGKGSLLDRILGGESELSAGRGLSKSSASLKSRTMMALEDEAGTRRVVSIKGGKVTAFDHGQAEDLGRIRGLETQGVKSRGEVLDRQLEPMQRELDRLETERRTLTATKGREASATRRIENIDNRAAELREGLQDAYRTDKGHLLSENDLRGRVFMDRNGKQWKITQATTKEIEANTGVRYYKNALASTVLNYLSLRKAERAYDFLESYKSSPEFQEVAAKMDSRRVPAGWRPSELPQFHGYAFEPHTAEVLDWYAKRMRTEGPNLYRQIGDFLRTAIFFNPLIHTPNIGVHWIVEKGLTGVGPQNWGRILRTGSRAIDAVIHQNNDFLSALDEGAPLQSGRIDSGATTKLLLERMGRELEGNPTAAQKIARALGYANPVKLIRAIYNFSGKVTWLSNDIAMLQATYEHMERTGDGFKDAMADVSKHIPDYRLPTRIFNSTALAKLMSNSDLTMFGAYHYGALRSYGEMAKGLLSEDMPQAERMKSLDRLAMLGLFTFVAYPALDQLAKYLTGDKTAQFRRAGASTFVYNLAQLAQGEKSPTQVLEAVATPAVHTRALLQLAANRDFFTGRHIVDWDSDAKTIGKQLAQFGGQNLAPVNTGMQVTEGRRTLGQQVAGLAGIKTKVPTPAEALARKFAAESAGTAAPEQDTLERSYLRKQYEADLRDKKIKPHDLVPALTAGKITDQDARTILHRAALTPLQNEFKGLPIEKALQVWQKADDQERNSLRALLAAKAERINPERYTPAQLKNLIGRIRNALTGSLPTGPPNQPRSMIPFTPPNGTVGSIGRRAGVPMSAPVTWTSASPD
jgi:hypothetical protein